MHSQKAIESALIKRLTAPERFERSLPEITSFEDIVITSLLRSYWLARHAWQNVRPMAISYRGCSVVAAGFGLRPDQYDPRIVEIFGYNVKTSPGEVPNVHAEEMVISQALALNALLMNIVVVGEPQPDNSTSALDPILAPCDYRCTGVIERAETTGNYTMTTCINPIDGTTQFIPLSMLRERNWDDIPAITVEELNDYEEWAEKAAEAISLLPLDEFSAELSGAYTQIIDSKRKKSAEMIAHLIAQDLSSQNPRFHASALASTEPSDHIARSIEPPTESQSVFVLDMPPKSDLEMCHQTTF